MMIRNRVFTALVVAIVLASMLVPLGCATFIRDFSGILGDLAPTLAQIYVSIRKLGMMKIAGVHVDVFFPLGYLEQAKRILETAEAAFTELTKIFNPEEEFRIEIILLTVEEWSVFFPFPYNVVASNAGIILPVIDAVKVFTDWVTNLQGKPPEKLGEEFYNLFFAEAQVVKQMAQDFIYRNAKLWSIPPWLNEGIAALSTMALADNLGIKEAVDFYVDLNRSVYEGGRGRAPITDLNKASRSFFQDPLNYIWYQGAVTTMMDDMVKAKADLLKPEVLGEMARNTVGDIFEGVKGALVAEVTDALKAPIAGILDATEGTLVEGIVEKLAATTTETLELATEAVASEIDNAIGRATGDILGKAKDTLPAEGFEQARGKIEERLERAKGELAAEVTDTVKKAPEKILDAAKDRLVGEVVDNLKTTTEDVTKNSVVFGILEKSVGAEAMAKIVPPEWNINVDVEQGPPTIPLPGGTGS
ncbi:MAG: hypothetical protein ACUVXI_03400 [bacterium]